MWRLTLLILLILVVSAGAAATPRLLDVVALLSDDLVPLFNVSEIALGVMYESDLTRFSVVLSNAAG